MRKRKPTPTPTVANDHTPYVDLPEPAWGLSIAKSVALTGFSRSYLHKQAAAGEITIVKAGGTRIVLLDTLRAHMASLPKAEYRAA